MRIAVPLASSTTLQLPRIVFVMGKGGVGRSTLATALGLVCAQRGERVLVVEWVVSEVIAPWFGLPPAGVRPCEVTPKLFVQNYRLDEALRAYFVDHLRLKLLFRKVIDGPHVRRLIEAAPGIAELLFVGQLWWLTTLAAEEAGLQFDRIIVDTPATGHGASLLDLPSALTTLGATGLLAKETDRVVSMMTDPAWTGALLVSLPDELSVEETRELLPRVTHHLGRPPLAVIANRSVSRLLDDEPAPSWLPSLLAGLPAPVGYTVETVWLELAARVRMERQLRVAVEGRTLHGVLALDDQLAVSDANLPRDVVTRLAAALAPHMGSGA